MAEATYKLPPIPTPPTIVNAPVEVVPEAVAGVIETAVPAAFMFIVSNIVPPVPILIGFAVVVPKTKSPVVDVK